MRKKEAEIHIRENLKDGENLIGFFAAMVQFKFWLFFFIGPLAVLSMKHYFIGVTDQGIYFHRLSLLGKFTEVDFFPFEEIKSLSSGKGMLQRPLNFTFENGRKIKLKAQLKGVEKIATLTEDMQNYLNDKIPKDAK